MPPPNAHRDLLVGLLALQTGLIDWERMASAFDAWSRGEERPIADILVEQGLAPERRELLEALVAKHLAQHGGDLERGLASVQVETSTREALSRLEDPAIDQSLFHVASRSTEADTETIDVGDVTAARIASTESDGVRYRVIRPHRKGGLGAVFVAVDAELNRQVALKRILDERADDEATRQRFLLEAEITAGLEHPGIVPVYGLGVYRDGRPFYAMRFIQGDSLKEHIVAHHHRKRLSRAEGPRPKPRGLGPEVSSNLELSKLLRRFLDVCNAIEYAHRRGVLHRDIKPGNILIGKYGETLVVDWGLAKASGHVGVEASVTEPALTPAASSGSGETLPHSRVGTPAYMSPEQARGDLEHVGVASDVYGLGASLYYLLVGRPPFMGRDLPRILEEVVRGSFPRPREVDPTLDRALEAVCLKAMALRPEDRYPSPRKLADDLERWLADEPVEAYAERWPRRAARWSRRHATLVTSMGILMVAGLLALGGFAGMVSRQNARLRAAYDEVSRQRSRAEASGTLARRAVNEMLHEVAQKDLLNIPQGEPVRLRMAERAAAFIRELDGLAPSDDATLLDEARILDEVASLYRMVGNYGRSADEFTSGIAIVDRLRARDPANPRYIDALAHAESQLGELIRLRGGTFAEAEPHYRRAVTLAGELRRLDPNNPNYAKIHATTMNDLANSLSIAARDAEAEPFARDAVAAARVLRASLPEKPDPGRFHMDYMVLPMCRATCGEICLNLGRDDWEDHLRRAIEEAMVLSRTYPTSQDAPFILVESSRIVLRGITRDPARLPEALARFDDHVAMIADLSTSYPSVRVYQRHLTRVRADRGSLRLRAGQLAQAEEDLTFAHERLREWVSSEPKSIPALRELARVKGHTARLAERQGQAKAARSRIDEALALDRQALAIEPDNRALTAQLAEDEAYAKTLPNP